MFEELKDRQTRMRVLRTSLAAVAISEAAGIAGSFTVADAQKEWFPTLKKPSFNPPSWLFAPVWTLLYAMMGVSIAAVWRARDDETERAAADRAIKLFSMQLALNALWSFIFFGRRSPKWAFVDIVGILIALVLTIRAIAVVSRPAAWLLAPYLLWSIFATTLNGAIWRLNPSER